MSPAMRLLGGFLVAVALLCIGGVDSMKLPSYVPACARNDPDLNACMKKNAEIALPEIIKGDRKYRVPPLEPFFVSELKLEEASSLGTPGYTLVLTNTTITGLSKVVVQEIKADLDKLSMELVLMFPHLELITVYKLSGRFLRLPITGEGPGNITMTTVKVDCKFDFKSEKKDDGFTYLIPETPELQFDIGGRLYLQLDNLLNGDKTIGDNMNAVLNDNWMEVTKSVSPSVAEVLAALLQQTIAGMFQIVPLEEIFI